MDIFTTLFQSSPGAFFAVTAVFGLLVGSFLNVVIYRLPIILKRQWTRECSDLLSTVKVSDDQPSEHAYNLIVPRSACPQCGHKITALENIPVLSYLLLRGKCRECRTNISLQYPVIEILTGVLSVMVAWHFGVHWATFAALLLTWALIALSVIDVETQLLPDNITLPFVWIGLVVNLGYGFSDIHSSVLGAVFGYLSLWSVYHAFKFITGKEGMGYGDFKLLAVLGAWLGWQYLPLIILLSSLVGAIVGISLILFRGRDKNIPIPFGPYLAIAGWIAMLWGSKINSAYLNLVL